MQIAKLRKVGNSMAITLPASVIEHLHLHGDDAMAIEIGEDCIVLTRATDDMQDAWEAYQKPEPRYRNTNRDLA